MCVKSIEGSDVLLQGRVGEGGRDGVMEEEEEGGARGKNGGVEEEESGISGRREWKRKKGLLVVEERSG